MTTCCRFAAFLLLFPFASAAISAERKVSSAADLDRAASEAQPGDVLILTDGEWKNQDVRFRAKGMADNPITLRAQTPGKVIFTGNSSIAIEGDDIILDGVYLDHPGGKEDGILIKGDHNRLTESAVIDGKFKFFVHLFGSDNRVDHCYLAGKTTDEPTLQIEVEEKRPNHDHIDHNDFGPRPELGHNGGETMRVGYSFQSMFSSAALVEQNLYDRCDGEIEIISSKSCDNIYRGNTFLNSGGMLTLRHGNRCVVENNFFFGQHKKGSGGIRVIGEDHLIINNYIEGVSQGAFWVTSGIPDSPLVGYFQAKRCVIAFNTVVDSKGPYIDLSAGLGTSKRTLKPENITIANNLFALPSKGMLLKGEEGEGWKWLGNIVSPADAAKSHEGIKLADVKLDRGESNMMRPAADAVRGLAEGDFPKVSLDIDGQPRDGKLDVGCDQISDAPITNRPLTAEEVGPKWMDVKQRESTVRQ